MGEAVDFIRRQLATLKFFREENSSVANRGGISDTVNKIHDTYLNFNLKIQDREILNAHLFNDQYGILSYLKSIILLDLPDIKQSCFRLLDDVLEQSGTLIQEYGSDMQTICLLYLRRDTKATVKKTSLITLSKVLEACQGYQGEKRIIVKEIIEELFLQLSLGAKLQQTVKEEVLILIGVCSHYYPEDFVAYHERVLSVFLQELKCQVNAKSKSPNYGVVSGCLQGLKEYLYNFSVLYSEEMENSYMIFNVAYKMISNTKLDYKVIRAGLQLLAAHAPQFALFIFENCVDLFDKLMDLLNHNNRDLHKLSRLAVDSVLKVTAEMLASKFHEDEKLCSKIFKYFMNKFRDIFVQEGKPKALQVAVMGYGLFAKPCEQCLSESEVKWMLQSILLKCEHEFFSDADKIEDKIVNLSCYSEALSSIISVIKYVPENTLFSLEKICVLQIDTFPNVPSVCSFLVPKSIILLLLSIQQKDESFVGFLSQIVYQGLVKTCSHPIVVEAEAFKDKSLLSDGSESQYKAEEDFTKKIVTYKDYIYLWKNMLNIVQLKELNSLGIPIESRQYLMESLYDELLRSSLNLISKLDLSLQPQIEKDAKEFQDEEVDSFSDPLHGVVPKNMTDYYIFLNLVDFLRDLLIESCTQLFSKWVFTFGKEMIFYSTKYPYHSGFYKLISLDLSICCKINYFKNYLHTYQESLDLSDQVCDSDVHKSFCLFSKFVREVSIRQQQFKDDLLASCLRLLLVLPIEIVLKEIHILIPALESALKLGVSYLPLAETAVTTLEKWAENVPREIMKSYFSTILPHLNHYLLVSTIQDDNSLIGNEKRQTTKKVHRMSTKSIKKTKNDALNSHIEDPALLKIQFKIIRFLGRLGESNACLLERAYQKLDEVAIAWDPLHRHHLKYSVPFVDMKPVIYFDDFLPHILEIALKSSVRQIKVAACEALHSLVLFMVGRGSQLPDALQEKYTMEALYKKLFPGLLELACDVEQVTKQLFTPLVLQIIRWFTCKKVSNTPETSVILLCLWDGVTNNYNAALRDFCAICLKEFFLWSIKQSSSEKVQKSTENLLNKLHSFSLHPNPFKRIGSALTFNNIYSIFRKEEALVKKYTIQLLIQFVESLAIAHTDDISLGTQKQCIIALDHIEKIIIVKHRIFLSSTESDKKPVCLEEATLQCAVEWLLRQCGCVQTECRHKSMDLVVKFSPLLPGFKGLTSFILHYYHEDKNIFDDVFEKVLHSFSQSDLKEKQSLKYVSLWLESLQTTMDCYQWSFSKQIMLQSELNGKDHTSLLSSVKVFKAIEYYLENFVKEAMSSVTRNSDEFYTPEEVLKFERLKCTVLVRLLSFLSSVFETKAQWFHEQFHKLLWNSSLWEVIILCVIDPSSLGFDMTDPETVLKLPLEVSAVIKLFSQKSEFKSFCVKYLEHKKEYNIVKYTPINLSDSKSNPLKLTQLLSGYELLLSNGFNATEIFSFQTSTQIIITSFLDSVWKNSIVMDGGSFKKVALQPNTFTLAEKMLSFVYLLGFQVDTLALRLLNPVDERSTKALGLIIFNIFVKNMCAFAAKTPHLFVKAVANSLHKESNEEISILLKFVDYVACTKSLRKKNGKIVIEAFLSCLDEILYWWKNHPDGDSIHLVLSILVKLILIDSDVALNSSGSFTSSLFSTYLLLLRKPNNSMSFIVSALEAVHFFFKSSGDNSDIRLCLEEIMANYFPLQSTELQNQSSAFHSYVSAVKQLLSALSLTGSEDLLEILTIFFCRESKHILEDEFQQSIISMIRGKHSSYHQKFADVIFNLVFSSSISLNADVYLSIVDKVLLLILENISITSLINFFKTHIKELLCSAKENISLGSSLKDVSVSKRIGIFKILQLMYQNLTKDILHSPESQIVETYFGKKPETGKELSSDISKICLDFKRTSFEMEPEYKDLLRKLNCAKYNTLIAVVSCIQNDLKFYNAFLFKENPIKNEKIWERIIDCENKMVFDLETDAPVSKKRKFISIRHKVRKERSESENSTSNTPVVSSSLQLFGSENLALSSLAEDVSKFVFSTKERVFDPPAIDRNGTSSSKEMFIERKHQEEYVKIEDDELNRHESMVVLCFLLQHMKSQNLITEKYESDQPPQWITCIIQCLEQSSENIQLLLGRLITNNAEILSPYARFLIRPMLDLIILGTAGFSLNYYILDVLVTLLSWAPTSVPQPGIEIHKASEVLKFVVSNCEHSRRDIFRNNLELIKTILECWKEGIEIPYNIIYEKMNDTNPESKKNVFGIQLLGIVVSSDFPPYNLNNESQGQSYLSILLKNMNNKFREVYGAASEVISIVLKSLLKDESEKDQNPFFLKVIEKIEILKKQDDGKFLYCLNKIHSNYPEIADKFIPHLLFLYPNMHGPFQNHILEVLCSRANNLRNGYQDLKSINMFENLEKKGEVVLHISLQTMEKLIPVLSCDDILHILPSIVDIHSQPSSICRFHLFKILFALFEKYSESNGAKEKEITRYAQETLLIGLADPDPSIRLMIDNFWSDEKRLPLGTKERILALMKNMFSPVTEESFLQYATFLLLERTSISPDFKLKIFEHPLSQCNFQAYQIQTSWRKRHLAMSPLFTESVSSSLAMSMDMTSSSFNQNPRVRATQQNNEFPETMDTDEGIQRNETYNWLTGKSLDTFAFQDFSYSSYGSGSEISKSHLIALKSDDKFKTGQKSSNEKKKSTAWMLKRRFLKDKPDSEMYARLELRKQDRKKELQKEQRNQRDAQVVMYRQYRIGELPDIEISNSAIIKPIQALAMHDATIAKILFKSLLVAICNNVKQEFPEGLEVLQDEIGTCFERILQTSFLYTPPVMSFCLETLNLLQDIKFDAETVFNACVGSNQQSIGILLFEAKLCAGFSNEPTKKKRRSNHSATSEESAHWMKLAELYRSVNAYDVVNGIFSLTMGKREDNRKALQHECSGQYYDAVVLYSKLYNETSDEYEQAEKDFWDKSMLSCYNKLCKWEDLEATVLRHFTNVQSPNLQLVWEEQYMKDNYMPYLVRSKLKQLLNGEEDQSLLTFFDTSNKDEEKKTHLEMHYNEEQALLYIIQDELDIARQYCLACWNRFLKDWQNLSPLSVEMQQSCLQNLIKYVELGEFLDFMKKNKYADSSSTIKLLKKWMNRFPTDINSVEIWDDVVSNRYLYLKKIKENLSTQTEKLELNESGGFDNNQAEFNYKKLILETSVTVKLKFAENCAAKGNFPVAVSILKDIYKVSKALDKELWCKLIHSYCFINNKRVANFPAEEKLKVVLRSWIELTKLAKKYGENPTQKKLLSQTLDVIADMFMKKEINMCSMSDEHIKVVSSICDENEDSEEISKKRNDEIIPTILEKSFLTLKNIAKVSFSTEICKQSDLKNFASAQMELANFCNQYLSVDSVSGFKSQSIPSFNEFPKILVESLLDALKYGSADALLLFPRLLQIVESYPFVLPVFQEKVSSMPCWLFLEWINQMVAILDRPEAKAIHKIVEDIALKYPDAIVYSFHLSYGSYKFSSTPESQQNKQFVEKVKQILERKAIFQDLVTAFGHLSVPHIIFKDYMNQLIRLVNGKATEQTIKACFTSMCQTLFNVSDKSKNQNVPVGLLQKKFAENYEESVLEACGHDGSKLLHGNVKPVLDKLGEILKLASKSHKKIKSLKEASPWLSEFQLWKYPTQVEIPGQYTGKRKPLPEYHVKIAGFDEKVLVLASLTLPCRITIRGDDEKEYKILVKSGEDLRQDARIQQIFSVMNDIYANDIQCAQRHLSLRTYKVIPLSTRLGLIEWVGDTAVLQEFLLDGMLEREKNTFYLDNGGNIALNNLLKWVKIPPEEMNIVRLYEEFYAKSRDQCIQKFKELENLVPRHLLSRSFTKLSSSPEAFLVLRNKFATSHAVISISQWVIGIGDRHLKNFLIDKSSGCEIGIDFGHAFGSATQFLPTPELVPFRLSPQYQQLMQPLKVKGIYESTMIHALTALCNKKDLLLNVMDIFIKEPTLDWKEFSMKQLQSLGIKSEGFNDDWFPKQRISIARKKLEGFNPCYITSKELELGHKAKGNFKIMKSVCLGNPENNVRAKYDKSGLSVEEQVDCLIDIATDPHVLCLTYFGWNPWM